jgi:hypothetical protein
MRRLCANSPRLESVEYRLIHRPTALEMLDDNAFEQLRGYSAIPDPVRIHDHDWTFRAHAEAGCFTTFDTMRAKQKLLTLEKLGKLSVQLPTSRIRRTEAAGAHEDVA